MDGRELGWHQEELRQNMRMGMKEVIGRGWMLTNSRTKKYIVLSLRERRRGEWGGDGKTYKEVQVVLLLVSLSLSSLKFPLY